MSGEFAEQLKAIFIQVTEELVRRAEADSRIGPNALLKQHGRMRKFPVRLFLELYLCPPSRAVAAVFDNSEPGWIISGSDVDFARLPEEGLPALPGETGYAVLLDILAERVIGRGL